MKTNQFKLNLAALLIASATAVSAQISSSNKTCIKINEVINGKEKHIDTCFTGKSEGEINMVLKGMGFNDITEVNGKDNENIVINSDGDEKGKTYAYATTGKDGAGTTTEVSVTSSTSEDGKEVKILVRKDMEVKDLTEDDKKNQPTNVSLSGNSFSDLLLYPNPTENSLTISYSTTSTAPLVIYIYDVNGKSVHMETVNTPDLDVNKTVSLEGLESGVYFVHLSQDGNVETKKIIVR